MRVQTPRGVVPHREKASAPALHIVMVGCLAERYHRDCPGAQITGIVIDRYARFRIRRRYIKIFATLILVGILASSGRLLQFTNDYRVFFGESTPQLEAFENLQDIYTKNDNVLINAVTVRRGRILG